ncbi:hypothetical protein [Bradyrhizobium denitrificans]|jgi:hypothetical protein|uniref:hypothetical protein n=1 Tax=Bradyrhizobium denitrificans TaxID=2734912 RepID=UPI00155493FC|nr:hypothetical protein [Bradyrhizobium sp. LMG 8443]NPU23919.1 hypothetical protein [Bradyrhizobium sp. LMG 8443]
MFWFVVALPGVIFAYAVVLRPLLHRITVFRTFYDEADGFWAKAWAMCGRSITVLWGYVLGGIGSTLALFDKLAPLVGAPDIDLQGKVKDALIEYPQIAGWVLFAISLITIWARVRTIGRSIGPTAADPNG